MKVTQYRIVLQVAQRDHVLDSVQRCYMHISHHLSVGHPELVSFVITDENPCLIRTQRPNASCDAVLILDIWQNPDPLALFDEDLNVIYESLL